MRIVLITTVPSTLRTYFTEQATALAKAGYTVVGISSPGLDLEKFSELAGASVFAVPMTRELTPFRDLRAVIRLWDILRRCRPLIVHTHTPKAGLLGMLAASLSRVPVRVYTINGLRWATIIGWRHTLLQAAEWLACAMATNVLCVSHSVRAEAIAAGVCRADKAEVLGAGSSHGVSLDKFDPASFSRTEREHIREQYGIPAGALVVGFVGRFVLDKGFRELLSAWQILRRNFSNSHLLLCGYQEQHDPLVAEAWDLAINDPRIHILRETFKDMPPVYTAMDVCVLPTYREGLPNVLLESAAMSVPVVASLVAGCIDAVRDGDTGLLVEPRNPAAIAEAVSSLLDNPALRGSMARAARHFVSQYFSDRDVLSRLLHKYRMLAQTRTAQAVRWSDTVKRACDICFASAVLVVAGPVLAVIAASTRLILGSPTFFRQKRIGYREQEFTLLKLRTMTDTRDTAGVLLPDELRMTPFGRLLRKFSCDEVPQLWNVLKGEMSIVGPRPLLPEYLPRYTAFQRRRHEVKPGITGWAQVKGRNALSWEQKFELDVWYIDHRGVWLDLKILAMTVWRVVTGKGISQHGHATMPEFLGTQTQAGVGGPGKGFGVDDWGRETRIGPE